MTLPPTDDDPPGATMHWDENANNFFKHLYAFMLYIKRERPSLSSLNADICAEAECLARRTLCETVTEFHFLVATFMVTEPLAALAIPPEAPT